LKARSNSRIEFASNESKLVTRNLDPGPHLKWALVGFSKVSIYPNHVSNPINHAFGKSQREKLDQMAFFLKMIFTNLHPKYDVQCVGGDALRKSIKLPLGIRVILNAHNLGSFFKFECWWFFDSERFTGALCSEQNHENRWFFEGFEVTRIGNYLILDYFPQKDTTGGPLCLKCSNNPNWWVLMKSNYSP
jgi:hypothetical protein